MRMIGWLLLLLGLLLFPASLFSFVGLAVVPDALGPLDALVCPAGTTFATQTYAVDRELRTRHVCLSAQGDIVRDVTLPITTAQYVGTGGGALAFLVGLFLVRGGGTYEPPSEPEFYDAAEMTAEGGEAEPRVLGRMASAQRVQIRQALQDSGVTLGRKYDGELRVPDSTPSLRARLEALKEARAAGLISEEEYARKRQEILDEF